MQEGKQTGALKNKTVCFFMVQYAPPALSPVSNKADYLISDNTTNWAKTPKGAALERSQKCGKPTSPKSESSKSHSKNLRDHLVSKTTTLHFPFENVDVHSTIRSASRLQTSYEIGTLVMRAAHYLRDTGAGVNFIRILMIPTSWAYRIKQNGIRMLCTATKEALSLDGSI